MARLCLSRLTGTRCNTHCNTHCNALHTSPRTTKTLLCLSRLTATTCTTQCNTHCNILQTATCLLCGWCFAMYCNAYCNTLQHNCNTLQHTLPYTLQHTHTCVSLRFALFTMYCHAYCNTLQHTATHCHTLQHTPRTCISFAVRALLCIATHTATRNTSQGCIVGCSGCSVCCSVRVCSVHVYHNQEWSLIIDYDILLMVILI